MFWNDIPPTEPTLPRARRHAHHAAQLASAAGLVALGGYEGEAQEDFPHESGALRWVDGRLEAQPVQGVRVGLELATLTLVADEQRLTLDGLTPADGRQWVGDVTGLDLSGFESPYDLGSPAPERFESSPPLPTLAAWYRASERTLRPIARMHGASPLLLWPHHLDLATLLDLGDGRSIGVGFSPGDASSPEPYLYVTAWPAPLDAALPMLPAGSWQQDSWFGARLGATELLGHPRRGALVDAFLRAAVNASALLLGAPPPGWPPR